MGEQNVVKIGDEAQETSKSPTARCLSELVSVTMDKAAARLSSVDADPIFREATLRAGIRDFAQALAGHFPESREQLPELFKTTGSDLAAGGASGKASAARTRPAGGSNAEHQKSPGQT